MKKYSHLSQGQRYQLSAFLGMNLSKKEIAEKLEVDPSTVYREINRNSTRNNYTPIAHKKYLNRRKNSRKKDKLTEAVKVILKEKIELDWSPQQISERLKKDGVLLISHVTIYKFISEDEKSGGKLYKHLRGKRTYRRKYGTFSRYRHEKKYSISNRSKEIEERFRHGDWEIDTVVSKKDKHAIVTLVDRKTRYTLIEKVKDLTRNSIITAITITFKKNGVVVHSLTSDNGVEFAGFKRLIRNLKIDYYFAHPYSSWERGTNENTNGLIRQYCPKGCSFKDIKKHKIKEIQDTLNNRPRKVLGYMTPKEFYKKEVLALAN